MSPSTIVRQLSLESIDEAARILEAGGIVALPTESYYGLAVDPFQPRAVRRLVDLKGRPDGNPFPLIAGSLGEVRRWFPSLPAPAEALAARFWPGPLTILLPAAAGLDRATVSESGWAGVRVPSHDGARALASRYSKPLTATSANRSGLPPEQTIGPILEHLGAGLDLILDGGVTAGGLPSTVLDLSVTPPRIIRDGAIPRELLREVLGELL